ncbi:MAG: glycosyltransferase family A protein [Pseudomonadota bacterium]
MSHPPRFSVIIPVHNKERHVAAALQSALGQSLAPYEIIVIDDASSDSSAAIVQHFENQVRILARDVPGPGGYAARNLGIQEATGEWIAFLDADDIWSPSHLADLAKALQNAPTAGCLCSRYDHVYADKRIPSRAGERLLQAAHTAVDFDGFLDIWLEQGECPIWTSASAFKRDVLLKAGLFPAGKAKRGGDKDLWLRAAALARFAYAPAPSAEFHRDADNKVSHSAKIIGLPILVETARALAQTALKPTQKRLRRLINQQIAFYARFSFKQTQISGALLKGLCLPEGFMTYCMIAAMRALPAWLRTRVYHRLKGA